MYIQKFPNKILTNQIGKSNNALWPTGVYLKNPTLG